MDTKLLPVEDFLTTSSTIIVLENSQGRRDYFRQLLSGAECRSFFFDKETICLDNIDALNPDFVILGLLWPERISRMIHALKAKNSHLPVMVVSDHSVVKAFVASNGFDNVRIIEPTEMSRKLIPALKKMMKTEYVVKSDPAFPQIVGNSLEMMKIKQLILGLSQSTETVLIQGETGTGKELVARAIHYRSNRYGFPFVKINCRSLSEIMNKQSSEDRLHLGFPGVSNPRMNIFQQADTGTLFFEEIGKIPFSLQADLLLMVEDGAVSDPVSHTKTPVDIRVLASTSKDLSRLVEKGEFRKDLYFRLNVFRIDMPPLRNRNGDISLLADFFSDRFCIENQRNHFDTASKAKQIFDNYNWPGNVTELEKEIKKAMERKDGHWMIAPDLIKNWTAKPRDLTNVIEDIDALAELSEVKGIIQDMSSVSLKDIRREFISRAEKKLIRIALQQTNWNRKKAALILDISYKSLLNKIKAYRLT